MSRNTMCSILWCLVGTWNKEEKMSFNVCRSETVCVYVLWQNVLVLILNWLADHNGTEASPELSVGVTYWVWQVLGIAVLHTRMATRTNRWECCLPFFITIIFKDFICMYLCLLCFPNDSVWNCMAFIVIIIEGKKSSWKV